MLIANMFFTHDTRAAAQAPRRESGGPPGRRARAAARRGVEIITPLQSVDISGA